MYEIRNIFLAVICICLLHGGFAQQYQDQYAENQFSDWQSTRSAGAVRSKPSSRNDEASRYEVSTNSSPNLTHRGRQRIRGRNVPDAFPTRYNNVVQGNEASTVQLSSPQTGQTGRNEYNRGTRQRNHFKQTWIIKDQPERTTVPEISGDTYNNTDADKLNQNDRSRAGVQNINRRNGVEFQFRRTQRQRSGNEGEQNINVATEVSPTYSIPPRSVSSHKGRQSYTQNETNILANTRTQTRRRPIASRYTTLPAEPPTSILTERSDSGFNVQQDQLNLAPQKVRGDATYTRDIQQVPFSESNGFVVQQQQQQLLIDQNPPQSIVNNEIQYQNFNAGISSQFQPTERGPDTFIQYNTVTGAPQFSETTPQAYRGRHRNQFYSTPNDSLAKKEAEKNNGPYPTETIKHYRNRQIASRSESKNNQESSPQFIYAESQKPRNNFRRGSKPAQSIQSNLQTDNNIEKTNSQVFQPVQSIQNVELGRQRRRQSLPRINQRTGVYTVLPSNAELPQEPKEYTTASSPQFTSRYRTENVPERQNVYRTRSRGNDNKQSRPQQYLETKEPDIVAEVTTAASSISVKHTTQTSIKAPVRQVRPITRVTKKPPQPSANEDIDVTANYPKEFIENIKTSKNYIPTPKYEVKNTYITSIVDPITAAASSASKIKRKPFIVTAVPPTTEKSEGTEKNSVTTTTPKARYSQSFYRKLSGKASYSSQIRTTQPTHKIGNVPTNRSAGITSLAGRTTTSTTPHVTAEEDAAPTERTEARRKFVPKNKVSLEERKHRIALLKEKLRQNATLAEKKNLKESLVVQANTHPGSREDTSHVAMLVAATKQNTEPRAEALLSPREESNIGGLNSPYIRKTKSDLTTLGSEDNVHVVYVTNTSAQDTATAESFQVTTTTAPATDGDVSATTAADFSVLNVTLFPSTRHRFSARINSTANITLPPDVELVTLAPTPAPETLENTATQDSPIVLSVQSLFNTSLNASAGNSNPPGISVTSLFGPSTQSLPSTTTTPKSSPTRGTTARSATSKKKASGRNNKKKTVSGNRRAPGRGSGSRNRNPTTTVRTPDNERNPSNNSSAVQVPSLAFSDIESIINETMEVVNSNPISSPQSGMVPRSELEALTPETISTGNLRAETTSPATTNNSTDNPTNSTGVPDTSDIKCKGESCQNANSQSLRINSNTESFARQSGTTKSPETLRKLFVYGIFPNNTVQRKPIDLVNSSVAVNGSERLTVSTTTQSIADYDVFGIYPNNSVVRRRGWKTFDHERYQSPYVIFGIYPNNTIVKKFPNGTTIKDEFMVSDNEIRNMVASEKSRGCACATSTTARPSAALNATENSETTTATESDVDDTTDEPASSAKDDAESVDFDSVNFDNEEARDTDASGTEDPENATESTNEGDEQDDVDEDENEDEVTTSPTNTDQNERSTTVQPSENLTKGLLEAEEADDTSTPRIFIDSNIIQDGGRGLQEAEEVDRINLSTTQRSEEELQDLINEGKGKTVGIVDSTESIRLSTDALTGKGLTDLNDHTEHTTVGNNGWTYIRPVEYSEAPYYQSTEKFDLYNRLSTPFPILKTTHRNEGTTRRVSFLDALLGNLLNVSKRLGISTLTPQAESRTESILPFSYQVPTRKVITQEIARDTALNTISTTTQRPSTTEEGLSIDLGFGLESTEPTTEENTERTLPVTTTPSLLPTTSTKVEKILKEDLNEVEALRELSSSKTNEPKSQSAQSLDESTQPTESEQYGEISTTTESTLGIIQRNGPSSGGEHVETVQVSPGYRYETPTPRRLGASGIYSIGFDENDLVTQSPLDRYQFDYSTTPFYHESNTLRPDLRGVTDTPDSFSNLRNLVSWSTGQSLLNGEGTEAARHFTYYPTTDNYIGETTTASNELLNALYPLSVDFIQSAGNNIKKRQRKSTKESDEPSSLTNIAYRALSSSDGVLPNVTTKPRTKTTKYPYGSNTKGKRIKNLSRTSVMAYKNLTEVTSTPLPESIYIVTPVPKTNDNDNQDDSKRGKVKFVTLTPGFVVTTNLQQVDNEIQTLSSQHVQKVTKAPANIPDNFLSTVVGEIEEKASSPIPEILKNVGNELQGDGLSVNLAKRIITLALEKAATSTTTQMTPQLKSTTVLPYVFDFTTPSPTFAPAVTTLKPTTSTNKAPVKKPKSTTKKPVVTEKPKLTTVVTYDKAETIFPSSTVASPTELAPVVLAPKRQTVEHIDLTKLLNADDSIASVSEVSITGSTKGTTKIPPGLDPVQEPFDKSAPTKTPSSQKVTEDLNALLSGLWEESATSTTSRSTPLPKPKPTISTLDVNLPIPKNKKTKNEKPSVPKKASDSLSESDLKLLESILKQQGADNGAQDLEQIIQNQIRLAEEVRKASRNLKKKQKTTTTTTPKPVTGGLGFLLSLFGGNAKLSSPPESKTKKPSNQLSQLNVNTPDPFNELDEGFATGDRTARGELVSAAIDVTKAVSKFMGTVLTNAAQSFQNFIRSFRS